MQFYDLVRALFALLSVKNLALIFKILRRSPGPEKIIGAKFTEAEQLDIKSFAAQISEFELLWLVHWGARGDDSSSPLAQL